MTPSEQVTKAILSLKKLFRDLSPAPPIPEGMTLETLWVLYQDAAQAKKKRHLPNVEDAVRTLLEDPDLAEMPISRIAEIVRETFGAYGVKCRCSESSVRWYQSQRNLEWAIVRRRTPKIQEAHVSVTKTGLETT